MGAGASTASPDREAHLFAFRVTRHAVDRLIRPYYAAMDRSLDDNYDTLCNYVKSIYDSSIDDYGRQLCDIQGIYCLDYVYSVSSDARLPYDRDLLDSLSAREGRLKAVRIKKEKASDYSQSFSGSALDTKTEKEAAELMKGSSADASVTASTSDDAVSPNLQPPLCTMSGDDDIKIVSKYSEGTWHKYDSCYYDCFMYFNSITKEVTARRPDKYEEDNDSIMLNNGSGGGNADGGTAVVVDPSNGLSKIAASDLVTEITRIIQSEEKTPFILDCSKEQIARNFFTYKGIVEDVSALTLPFAKSGLKKTDVLERCRKSLVAAMKSGRVFALYLGDVTIDHICFKKLCKKDCFPFDVFVNGGLKLLKPESDPKYKLIFHPDELENGEAVCREGFRFVIISSLNAFDYEKLLEDCIPLGYSSPFYLA